MSADQDREFKVQIGRNGQLITIPTGKTIVETLDEHDIDITVSCEQGICGTCLTGVLAGKPDHRDSYMTDEEHQANDLITVCCSRSYDDVLVLDL